MDCSPSGFSVREISRGKNTGVDCHFLLQRIFLTQGSNPCLHAARLFISVVLLVSITRGRQCGWIPTEQEQIVENLGLKRSWFSQVAITYENPSTAEKESGTLEVSPSVSHFIMVIVIIAYY